MADTNYRFIECFEAIKDHVNERARMKGSHNFELETAAISDRKIANYERLLRYMADIRNLLVHPKTKEAETPAISVSAEFLAEAQAILRSLSHPQTASSICIPRGRLAIVRQHDEIGPVMDLMAEKKFSHIPILDENDVLVGVFNESAIFNYFMSDSVIDADRHIKIAQMQKHCRLSADRTETFEFTPPFTSEDAIIEKFAGVSGKATRVGAIFVTPSGNRRDKITGMITPWDVLTD